MKFSLNLVIVCLLLMILGVSAVSANADVLWSNDVGNVFCTDISADGNFVFAGGSGKAYCFDNYGTELWSHNLIGNAVKIVCSSNGEYCITYTDSGYVYSFDLAGDMLWSALIADVTDVDISESGRGLIVSAFGVDVYYPSGELYGHYTSVSAAKGQIASDDSFIVLGQKSGSTLYDFEETFTDQYWGYSDDSKEQFDTTHMNYQNFTIIHPVSNNSEITWSNVPLTAVNISKLQSDQYAINDEIPLTHIAWNLSNILPRKLFASIIYDDKIWIMGGENNGLTYNDVWYSSDGIIWTQATTSAAWSPRSSFGCVVYDDKIWVIGGCRSGYNSPYKDVWYSSDGVTWIQATASAAFGARFSFGCVVYDNKIWVMGGLNQYNSYGVLVDAWYSSNGVTWTRAGSFDPRFAFGCVVYDDKIWVMGGGYFRYDGTSWPSVYYSQNKIQYTSDGVTWTQATASAAFGDRSSFGCVVYDDKIWVIGGGSQTIYYSSDGITWVLSTQSFPVSPNECVCNVYTSESNDGGYIYCLGGLDSCYYYNGFWSSTIYPTLLYNDTLPNVIGIFSNSELRPSNASQYDTIASYSQKPTLSNYSLKASKTLSGTIQQISLPSDDSYISVAASDKVWNVEKTLNGFGNSFSAAASEVSKAIAATNTGSMSIEGREIYANIYSRDAQLVGTYTAGNTINSVDIAVQTGLYAAAGSADGKVYLFSKDQSSNWYLDYSSEVGTAVTSVAMSASGTFTAAGRSTGLTLYKISSWSTNPEDLLQTRFWYTLKVLKDGNPYKNKAIDIYTSKNGVTYSTDFERVYTDSSGSLTILVNSTVYYRFSVGNEKTVVVQATPNSPYGAIIIQSLNINQLYDSNAVYDSETNQIKMTYTDTNGAPDNIRWKVVRTDNYSTVFDQSVQGVTNSELTYNITDTSVTYKAVLSTDAGDGGAIDIPYFISPSAGTQGAIKIPIPLDEYMMNAMFLIFLMFLGGLFSYTSGMKGCLIVSFTAGLLWWLGFITIPWFCVAAAIGFSILMLLSRRS